MNLFNWQESYPNFPGHRNNQPSIDGAKAAQDFQKSQYNDILRALRRRPMIAEEIMAFTGIAKTSTMSGRLSEMTHKGMIKKALYRMKSSSGVMVTVWEVV